jgi:hypothetical protein
LVSVSLNLRNFALRARFKPLLYIGRQIAFNFATHVFVHRAFCRDTLSNAAQSTYFNIDMVRKKLRGKIGQIVEESRTKQAIGVCANVRIPLTSCAALLRLFQRALHG